MLLAVDVGNSNIVLGLFDGRRLAAAWRLTTHRTQTEDELVSVLAGLFQARGIAPGAVTGAIVASVVPPLDGVWREALQRQFGLDALFVGPGVKTGMRVLYDAPGDVGADRIAAAAAGFAAHGGPLIIVDMGTATTFDVVTAHGEYRGGLIYPGLGISAEALFARAARLPRVEIRQPEKLIGSTTVGSIQSGLFYGYLSLIEGVLARLRAELGSDTPAIATGGFAHLIAPHTSAIAAVEENLMLEGLRLLWERNAVKER